MDQNPTQPVGQTHEEITRMERDGVRPADFNARMDLMRDKFAGNAPLGVDAPTKGMRKAIGGAGSLLVVLKSGIFGALSVILGGLFCWAGAYGTFDAKSFGLGVAGLALGFFMLTRAVRAWKVLQAIRRA